MKKFFAFMAAACCAMALSATTYTCHLMVDINGATSEQDGVEVDVLNNNGLYELNLKNFCLISDGNTLPVGNITVTGVEGVDQYGYTTIKFNNSIVITPGNNPEFAESEWIGQYLGDVPLDLTSRFTGTALSANIDIDMMSAIQQIIKVSIFGVAPVIKGDVNNDSEVNIGDVNAVINIILN